MALTVEDGSGVVGANTYVDAAAARAFALLRGVTLSTDDADVEAKLINAMDYIEPLEPRFKGHRTESDQPLSWPRTGAYIVSCTGSPWPGDQIPPNLISAQNQLVIAQQQGIVLQPSINPSTQLVKRKKVDVLETEFFAPGEVGQPYGVLPSIPSVDALLQPLMCSGGGVTAIARRG